MRNGCSLRARPHLHALQQQMSSEMILSLIDAPAGNWAHRKPGHPLASRQRLRRLHVSQRGGCYTCTYCTG